MHLPFCLIRCWQNLAKDYELRVHVMDVMAHLGGLLPLSLLANCRLLRKWTKAYGPGPAASAQDELLFVRDKLKEELSSPYAPLQPESFSVTQDGFALQLPSSQLFLTPADPQALDPIRSLGRGVASRASGGMKGRTTATLLPMDVR